MKREHGAVRRVVRLLALGLVAMAQFAVAASGDTNEKTDVFVHERQAAPQTADPIAALLEGVTKAWQLTLEGYNVMGGRPSLASDKPILRDQIPAAKEKFTQSEQVLDGSEPTGEYPHDQFPQIYAHGDFVRASNLHALGMIKLLEGDAAAAERYIFRSLELAEGSFKVSQELMSDAAFADNAHNCASLLVELHALSAFIATAKGNEDSKAAHEKRLQELIDWAKANPR